jgi:tetratricopeptide (TPR) repeat protein
MTNQVASTLDAEAQLRAYLRLQEQLHATLLAVEQGRLEASLEARTNSESLAARLETLEQALAREREHRSQDARESNRFMLLIAICAIGLGLMALAFTALFQSRGMNRLADVAAGLSQERGLMGPLGGSLGAGNEPLLLSNGNAMNTPRALLATVEQLQQRIQDLERTTQLPLLDQSPEAGGARIISTTTRNGGSVAESVPDHLPALIGKAQVLLSLGQTEEALACYDRALVEAPNQAEIHLRRGQALERLKRFDEAIASYDRALALNRQFTQAYLSKGAVYNQQERYGEALACYEQALRLENKA